MNERFAAMNIENAPDASRRFLEGSARQFGFVPSPVAKAARSPALLAHLLAGFAAFDRSSLGEVEREVVAMTVARANGCHYCMALHSATMASDPKNAALVAALRAGAPLDDPRLDAIRRLANALVEGRGAVSDDEWRAFEAAGLSEQQGLDVVLGVGVYVLSTFANIATRAPLDAPFLPFAWTRE